MHIPSLFMARHRRRRLQLQFSTNRFWNSHNREAWPASLPGAAVSAAHSELLRCRGQGQAPSACCPRHRPGHSNWGHPQQPCHPLHPTLQAPIHPAMPNSNATSSGKPSLLARSWEGGVNAHLSFSGLSPLSHKTGSHRAFLKGLLSESSDTGHVTWRTRVTWEGLHCPSALCGFLGQDLTPPGPQGGPESL